MSKDGLDYSAIRKSLEVISDLNSFDSKLRPYATLFLADNLKGDGWDTSSLYRMAKDEFTRLHTGLPEDEVGGQLEASLEATIRYCDRNIK